MRRDLARSFRRRFPSLSPVRGGPGRVRRRVAVVVLFLLPGRLRHGRQRRVVVLARRASPHIDDVIFPTQKFARDDARARSNERISSSAPRRGDDVALVALVSPPLLARARRVPDGRGYAPSRRSRRRGDGRTRAPRRLRATPVALSALGATFRDSLPAKNLNCTFRGSLEARQGRGTLRRGARV